MAHFAKVNNENIVEEILVINNNVILDDDGIESELKGREFLIATFGSSLWVQTSYNGTIRKNYAGIGYTYDTIRDSFIPPIPHDSWNLNEETCQWESPTLYPTDGRDYTWNEDETEWVLFTPTKPYDSWIWNETEWEWESPTLYPTDGEDYTWNEDTLSWVEFEL